MRLEIHHAVYGRVEQGVSGSGSGFQWAAHTDELRATARLLDVLTMVGRIPDPRRSENLPRLGYFCPVPGWVAFLKAVWGVDSSGRQSGFSHFQLVRRADVLRTGLTTAAILRQLRFSDGERALPEGRWGGRPETIELESADPALLDTPLEPCGAAILDAHLNGEGVKLVWVTDKLPAAAILDGINGMQSLLPPEVAVDYSFCLHFCHSLEGLAAFQMLTVPEEALLGQPRSQCRLFGVSSTCPERSPFASMVGDATAPVYRKVLARLGGHGPWSDEERECVLRDPASVPVMAWAERLWPDWCLDWLAAEPGRYTTLHTAIGSWAVEPVRARFLQQPDSWLRALGSHLASLSEQRGLVCRWVVGAWAAKSDSAAALLLEAASLGWFADVSKAAIDLGPSLALPAAEALATLDDAQRGFLHRAIARHLITLRTLPERERASSPWAAGAAQHSAWLSAPERRALGEHESSVLAALPVLLRGRVAKELPGVDAMDEPCYRTLSAVLLHAAAQGERREVEGWKLMLSPRSHRQASVDLLLKLLETGEAGPAFTAAAGLGLLNLQQDVERLLTAVENNRNRTAAKAWLRAVQEGVAQADPEILRRLDVTSRLFRGLFG